MITKVKMRYSQATSFTLAQAIQKLSSTPTDGKSACRIRNISRQMQDSRKKIVDDFQTKIAQVYGKKNDLGELIRPEDQPNGFIPLDGKEDEFEKAEKEFAATEMEVECFPLTLNEIKDVKLSAQELEALGGLFTEELAKPELPENVRSMR